MNSDNIAGTVVRHKPAGRQALPSQWLAQEPIPRDAASEGSSGAADVVPPTIEPQEADKEQKVARNGRGKWNARRKKKKDDIAAQNASPQSAVGEVTNPVDTSQAVKEKSQPAPDVVAEVATQASQDEPKKTANKRKKSTKRGPSVAEQTSNIPSAPVENTPAESAPVESAPTIDTREVTGRNESPSPDTTKPYRANAGGSLHVGRHRYKPAVRDIFAPPQHVHIPEELTPDNARESKSSTIITDKLSPERQREVTKEQTRKKIHGSFGNLDVGFNPWPRAPSGEVWSPTKRPTAKTVAANTSIKRSTTPAPPPQVIIEPAASAVGDTVTKHGLPTPSRVSFKDTDTVLGLGEEIYTRQGGTGSKKPSGSSFVSMAESQYTTASYHTAKSSMSEGGRTPPESTPPASP